MIRNPTKQAIFRLVIHLLKNCRKALCEAIFYIYSPLFYFPLSLALLKDASYQSKVKPPPFVMMIGVYSTRRTLPSLRVTVPSVLFQSRMVSLPLLKVLLASLASWKTRTREVVVPLKYILYVPAGISSQIVSTFQVAANTLRHASGCRCYVIPDTNLSTVKAPHHVSGAGRSGIQNRKRAR